MSSAEDLDALFLQMRPELLRKARIWARNDAEDFVNETYHMVRERFGSTDCLLM